jgi:hypothetical protein
MEGDRFLFILYFVRFESYSGNKEHFLTCFQIYLFFHWFSRMKMRSQQNLFRWD